MQYLVLVGALCSVVFGSVYLIATIQGRAQPNKVTWLLWAVSPLISVVATIAATGFDWSILPVFMAGFMPLLVFIASMFNKSAYWKLSFLDYLCGIVAIFAIIIWRLTDDPILAIIFSILSDAIASLPTLHKAWLYPNTEAPVYYIGGVISSTSAILAATTHWSFSTTSFPIYLFILDTSLMLIVILRKAALSDNKMTP
ncbi:hypothetical protein [Weissella fangxianensis]|uniref:hypothetical protein n=1 Tax=Weissella fangxianensis TaxID=2953879 RepID=UPI0021588F92|nr:hypothetical protein [Weissella fangxianensis]